MKMKITARALIAGAALALVVSTGALAADRPDSWVTTKTKLALMTTEGIDTWDLNVDTVSGASRCTGRSHRKRRRRRQTPSRRGSKASPP